MTEQLLLTLAPGIEFTPRELRFPPNLSFEDWIECGRFLKYSSASLDFWKADWLEAGRNRFGIEQASEAVGQLKLDLGEVRRVEALNRLAERSSELSPEHHFVLSKARLDETGQSMWMDLAEKERLSPRELQESIRAGSVVHIKVDPDKDRGVGFASFESWYLQWKLLRKQIEDVWRDWTIPQAREAIAFMEPVETFLNEVRKLIGSENGDTD